MRTGACFHWISIYLLFIILVILPFLPGDYDPLSVSLSASVQLYSGLGLLTCIPAALWLYHTVKHSKIKNDDGPGKHKYYIKICLWHGRIIIPGS